MLTKIIFFIALLLLGSQVYTWLMQIDAVVLREVTSSIVIALILQPFVIHQFR